MLFRKERYESKKNPNKALFYSDPVHGRGRIHSEFICKIYRYYIYEDRNFIKKQVVYVFKRTFMPTAENPEGIQYVLTVSKSHNPPQEATLGIYRVDDYKNLFEETKSNIAAKYRYSREAAFYFNVECDDKMLAFFKDVVNYKIKTATETARKAQKRAEKLSKSKDKISIKQTWSTVGIKDTYKTNNEDELISYQR